MSRISKDFERALHQTLERQSYANVWLRDDDIDVPETTLERLLELCARTRAPITLAVVPGRLTRDAITFLRDHQSPNVELHQHGWTHTNHETVGRKCEFGPSRSFAQQLADIRAGQSVMHDAFGDAWYPAFTPPWNRCTDDTAEALLESGHRVLSTDHPQLPVASALEALPITLDIFDWKRGATLREPAAIVADLIAQIDAERQVGLLLHHKVMDDTAFEFLEWVLRTMAAHPHVRFGTFGSLTNAHDKHMATTPGKR